MDILLKETKVAYKAVEVKDAVKVAPLMDLIEDAVKTVEKERNEGKNEKEMVIHFEITTSKKIINMQLKEKTLIAIRDTLKSAGFCTSY